MNRRLQPLGQDIWVCEGENVDFYGFAYPTRMVVVRLPDGCLWVWSPVRPDADLFKEVTALGEVGHLVSPNKLHHLFLGEWKERFADALIWGPQSSISKRTDLAFEAALDRQVPVCWGGALEMFHFTGSRFMDELVFFHRDSATAILADLSENFSPEFVSTYWKGWKGVVARIWGIMEGKAPLEWRLSFLSRKQARAERDRLLALHPRQVVMAHGTLQRQDGEAFLRRVLGWMG